MLKYFLVDDYDYDLVEVSREDWVADGSVAWHEIAGRNCTHFGGDFDSMVGINTVGVKTNGNYAILIRDLAGGVLLYEHRYTNSNAVLDAYRPLRRSDRTMKTLLEHCYLLDH